MKCRREPAEAQVRRYPGDCQPGSHITAGVWAGRQTALVNRIIGSRKKARSRAGSLIDATGHQVMLLRRKAAKPTKPSSRINSIRFHCEDAGIGAAWAMPQVPVMVSPSPV